MGQLGLLLYAAAMWLISAAFVRWYEEPALGRRFGSDYDAYRRTVPAWWPRLRPWNHSETNQTHGDAPSDTVWSYTSLLLFINCLEDPCSRKPDCRSVNPRDGGRR
jgi:hypothetical protein